LGGKSKFLILILSCYSTLLFALNPATSIDEYGYRIWTNENGLPQNSILAITQTRDGYLWLGTQAGLARFDGVRFHVFSSKNSPIKNNDVLSLVEDKEGGLWIGTFGAGISRYKDGKFTNYGSKEGLTDEVVRCLFVDWRGVLWIGTRTGGIFAFEKGRFRNYSSKNGLANDFVRSISEDADGNLWIGTENGLSRFRDGKFTTFTTTDGLSNNSVRWIFKDGNQRLWIATDSGLTLYENGRFSNPVSGGELINQSVRFVTEDRDRNIWIATDAGLDRIQNGKLTSYSNLQSSVTDPIVALYEDREGNFWIGTDGGGLLQLKDLKFRNYGASEGLPNSTVYSILQDHNGVFWIGTRARGLFRWKDQDKKIYTTDDGLLANTIFALYEDSNGDLWVGTRAGGINKIRDGKVIDFHLQKELSNLTVRTILQTRDGSYWIGTNSGLNRWKDGAVTVYTTANGLSNDFIHCLLEDRDGTLWIGTFHGLSFFKNGKFGKLSGSEKLNTTSVWSLYQDPDGGLWASTYGSGLFYIHSDKISEFSVKDGLFEDTILSMLVDNDQNFWMCTYHGIFKINRSELLDVLQGKKKQLHSTVYDASDGMKSSEGVGGVQPAGWKTASGKLLFLTVKGITQIDPHEIKTNPLPPPVHLEDILYDGKRINSLQLGRTPLAPGNGDLEFHYTALSFVAPERVRFRYQLQGFDKDWVDASSRRVAFYTKVPPGNYRFQVIASNNDEHWNDMGADFVFQIKPHFYETYWFYAIWILIFAAAIFTIYRLRLRRLRTQFSAVLEERNRISREIHDTLTQDFTAVVLQLETAEITLTEQPDMTKDALQRARELARSGLAESRRFVRALRPAPLEHSDLAAALSVVTAQALGGSGVEYKVQVTGKKRVLAQTVEDNLLRITQEAMTNVVKHAQAKQVEIEMIYRPLRVDLKINDDGCGFDIVQPRAENGGGFGIISMKERAAQMRGKVKIVSTEGKGTAICVSVPRW
jgi:ligand-binding sensor domain-containing protein/signal transduction histidine kinase